MRAIGIDYGKTRVGLAISDPEKTIALPHSVLQVTSPRNAARQITIFLEDFEFDLIVVGLPLLLSGKEGAAAAAARTLAMEISKRTKSPIVFQDERFSSHEAESSMKTDGLDERQRRGKVDKIAAAMILQTYLDKINKA
jgi:putative Holliday junction resolvase